MPGAAFLGTVAMYMHQKLSKSLNFKELKVMYKVLK